MRFSCDKCGRAYVAGEKVAGRAFKMRCKRCGHVIVVRGRAAAPETAGTAAGPAEPASTPATLQPLSEEAFTDLTAELGDVAEARTPTPRPVPVGASLGSGAALEEDDEKTPTLGWPVPTPAPARAAAPAASPVARSAPPGSRGAWKLLAAVAAVALAAAGGYLALRRAGTSAGATPPGSTSPAPGR